MKNDAEGNEKSNMDFIQYLKNKGYNIKVVYYKRVSKNSLKATLELDKPMSFNNINDFKKFFNKTNIKISKFSLESHSYNKFIFKILIITDN